MRLIDADKLREEMYHEAFETDTDLQKWDSGCWIRYKMFENILDKQEIIEAVEVVRCENCKHYKPSTVVSHKMCFRKDVDGVQVCYDFKPDDFCRYGERKEDETD